MSGGGPGPLVSIVTVSLNRREELAATLDSVAGQTLADREIVVVDGGSTDGSAALLAGDPRVDRWISEPDRGIYDAMNKGVALARGDWVLFMNAGDCFTAPDTLARLADRLRSTPAGIVYGGTQVLYPDGLCLSRPALPLAALPRGMVACHQSILARRPLLLTHPFPVTDDRRRLAWDYGFLVGAWRAGVRFEALADPIARVTAGGVSDTRRLDVLRHRQDILRCHGLLGPALALHYRMQMLRAVLAAAAKAVLPAAVVRRARTAGTVRG